MDAKITVTEMYCNCMLFTIHVSCAIILTCSATTGYFKSNLDMYYQQTNVLFLMF